MNKLELFMYDLLIPPVCLNRWFMKTASPQR